MNRAGRQNHTEGRPTFGTSKLGVLFVKVWALVMMLHHSRSTTLLLLFGGLVVNGCAENGIGNGRQLDVTERTSKNVYDGGPIVGDSGVVQTIGDSGVTMPTDGGGNDKPDAGETFNPFPNVTVGTRCTTGDFTNWIVLTALPPACDAHGSILADGPDGNALAFAQLPDNLVAPTTVTVQATVCLTTTGCEQRSMDLRIDSFTDGTGMTGAWTIQLDQLVAAGDLGASWCGYDDLRPGGASTLAGGIAMDEVALYQSVKISLMQNGTGVGQLNAPIVQARPALIRIFVDPDATWTAREIVGRVTLENSLFSEPRIYEERLRVTGASTETNGNSTFNIQIPPESMLTGTSYSVGLYETEACVPESGDTSQALFPGDGSSRQLSVESNGSSFNVVMVPVRYNADGSGRLPDTSAAQMSRYEDLMFAMFPIADLNITVANPLDWNQTISRNGSGWSGLLEAIRQARSQANPPDNVYYYGIFTPASSFGAYCGGGCVAGLGNVPSPNDVSRRAGIGLGFTGDNAAETFVHEIGHTLGRNHAPCGVQQADGNYPYNGARLGVYGYNILTGTLYDPDDTRDVMSYCDPVWLSDYTYDRIFNRIATANQGFPFAGPMPSEWKVLVSDMDGTRWGRSMIVDRPPSGEVRQTKMYDRNGRILAIVESYAVPYDHIDGYSVMVPEPPDGTVLVDVEGLSPLPL